jgi:type IV pilus assembly protein PilN
MRFGINLATQPYQDVQRFLMRWGLAAVGLFILTIVLVYSATGAFLSWRVAEKRENSLRQQIAERDRQKLDAESYLNRPENREVRDRSQFLNNVIARKAFSWTEVFTDLENLVPARMHVLVLRPEVNQDNQLLLHINVAGSSRDAAIELVRRLEHSPHFHSAQIDSEAAIKAAQNQPDTARFDISAIYIPSFARPQKTATEGQPSSADATATSSSPQQRQPQRSSPGPAAKPPEKRMEVRNAGH